MKYKLHKETNSSRRSYGKYVAKAVHQKTVSQQELMQEIESNCSAKVSDCHLVLCELADTLVRHLHDGDIVELPYIGKIRLEIECQAVEEEQKFRIDKHVKGVRLHLLPKSKSGKKELYDGITLSRIDKD